MNKITRFVARIFHAANHDFCPSANRFVYWLKKPIGWVVAGLLFSFLIGVMIGPQGYVLAIAFLTLLILGVAWPWVSMKGIESELILPDGDLQEHQRMTITLRVSNYWPIPVFGVIIEGDFLQDAVPNEEPIAFSLKRIPPLSKTDFPIEVTPLRRGVLPSGQVLLKNGFPFGLTDVAKPVNKLNPALVWPACYPTETLVSSKSSRFSLFGKMSDRSSNEGETIGVRAYREGDQLRSIHWAQTVRSERLMVRERQSPASTPAVVVLDLSPQHHVGHSVHSSFEWAIRIAASLCSNLHQMRCPVRLLCLGLADMPEQWRPTNNARGVDQIMDHLAGLPTLDGLRKRTDHYDSSDLALMQFSKSEQVFFVGTAGSNITGITATNIRPILLETDSSRWEQSSTPVESERGVNASPVAVPSALSVAPFDFAIEGA